MTHKILVASVFVMGVGCALEEPEVGLTESEIKGCPDPDYCTVTNGNGVYVEAFGHAGIGPDQFLITHFINQYSSTGIPVGVGLEGRYFDPSNGWRVGSGAVIRAYYQGLSTPRQVLHVEESYTVPTWTLDGGTVVTADQIADLKIVIYIEGYEIGGQYTLGWSHYDSAPDPTELLQVRHAQMQWKITGTSSWNEYCFDRDGAVDPVVFMQGIAVNAVNAQVARDNDLVTLACRKGAMPSVRAWGYPHRPTSSGMSTFYFDAGLVMKRAAYCGDKIFFTEPDTVIHYRDDVNVQTPLIRSELEAAWGFDVPSGRMRALCINLNHRRQPEIFFDGECPDGKVIPSCSQILPPLPSSYFNLVDKP